jgi:hypothetical protein
MVRWVASRMAEAFGYGNLLKEWYRFKVEPPLWTGEGNTLTINDYCDFWTSQEDAFPALSDCIKRFVRLNPTEASCERSFSVLKFAFPRLRTSAQSDLVESTVVGMSAVAFRNRQLRFDDDEEPREEEQQEKEKEDEEDKLQPPPLNDTAVRLIMDVWNTIATEKVAKEPLLKQRRTEDQDRCGLCQRAFRQPRGSTLCKMHTLLPLVWFRLRWPRRRNGATCTRTRVAMSVLSSRHPLIQPVAPAMTKSNIFSLFSNTTFSRIFSHFYFITKKIIRCTLP